MARSARYKIFWAMQNAFIWDHCGHWELIVLHYQYCQLISWPTNLWPLARALWLLQPVFLNVTIEKRTKMKKTFVLHCTEVAFAPLKHPSRVPTFIFLSDILSQSAFVQFLSFSFIALNSSFFAFCKSILKDIRKCRYAKMPKCQNTKMPKRQNAKMPKCRNAN